MSININKSVSIFFNQSNWCVFAAVIVTLLNALADRIFTLRTSSNESIILVNEE